VENCDPFTQGIKENNKKRENFGTNILFLLHKWWVLSEKKK
jgi:hypothetical protein